MLRVRKGLNKKAKVNESLISSFHHFLIYSFQIMTAIQSDRELVFSRLLKAPRELVFDVWTQPEHLAQWWGPNGFSLTTKEMDVKPGGTWRFIMHGPDGRDYKNKIVFTEVRKPELLAYRQTGEDDTEDIRFEVTITFDKQGDQTRLTMRSLFATPAELQHVVREYGAAEGAIQHLSRLEEYVARIK